ncbi:MAG TPA: alpha/beta fold hydrolase [Adhaeribacter sp.]|nr:alpha/beta fold hydrolase [Adhaeribacter sp.]
MKKLSILLLLTIVTLANCLAQHTPQTIAGSWNGALNIGGTKLRLVFHINTKPDGTLTATMDSPDQGAKGIPVTSARLVQDSLYLDIKAIGGSYAGKITGPETIDGQLKQAGQTMHIPLAKGEAEALKRPQHPVKPYPYQETEVTIENKTAGIKLVGTLTKPNTQKPVPAVILITGSGPQDRDQTIMGHKPFLVIADHLTRQGFAVLRLDDRGTGKSGGNFATATTDDFATDIEAAYSYLRSFSGVNPKKIGLIGHSEGALVAGKVAAKHPTVAFVVLMAGNAVPGTELLVAQNEALLKAAGMPEPLLQKYLQLRKTQFEVAATEKDVTIATEKIKQLEQDAKATFTAQEIQQMGLTPQSEQTIAAQLGTPWWRTYLAYNPAPTLQKLKMPVLALYGTKDLQVPYQQNLAPTEKALKAAGNKKYKVREMPNLNHLFQTATSGMVNEYGQLEETIAPVVLEEITSWIKEVVK